MAKQSYVGIRRGELMPHLPGTRNLNFLASGLPEIHSTEGFHDLPLRSSALMHGCLILCALTWGLYRGTTTLNISPLARNEALPLRDQVQPRRPRIRMEKTLTSVNLPALNVDYCMNCLERVLQRLVHIEGHRTFTDQ